MQALRVFLKVVACVWFASGAVFADGIHSAPFVLQDVVEVKLVGQQVQLNLKIENLGKQAVALQAVSAEGTVRQTLYPAPAVEAKQANTVALELQFYREVPHVFTLVMDYGLDGVNTTLVQLSK